MLSTFDIEPRWPSVVRLGEHAPRPYRVLAFGSRARGRARRFSDLDLATCSERFRAGVERAAVPLLPAG